MDRIDCEDANQDGEGRRFTRLLLRERYTLRDETPNGKKGPCKAARQDRAPHAGAVIPVGEVSLANAVRSKLRLTTTHEPFRSAHLTWVGAAQGPRQS